MAVIHSPTFVGVSPLPKYHQLGVDDIVTMMQATPLLLCPAASISEVPISPWSTSLMIAPPPQRHRLGIGEIVTMMRTTPFLLYPVPSISEVPISQRLVAK